MFQKKHSQLAGYGYRLVDPLLGWGLTHDAIGDAGYNVEHNTVVLKSSLLCTQPRKIWISGGSTTDVVLDKNNWPTLLKKMLEQNNLCADLYIAATGGFSSGQELLKLIRDGSEVKPNICISYSGANEHLSPSYVSRQEFSFYYNTFNGQKPYPLLPNTIHALRKHLLDGRETLHLLIEERKDAHVFWAQNMQLMHSICKDRNAFFIGILQPVAGTSEYSQPNVESEHTGYVNANRSYYPSMITHADSIHYLHNFTSAFDTVANKVYRDDCHIYPQYQPIIAKSVFKILFDNWNNFQQQKK